jgi:hypothetical protein
MAFFIAQLTGTSNTSTCVNLITLLEPLASNG